MTKLNDTQLILLSTAAQRDGGNLYPLPATLNAGPRVATAVAGLLKAGFAEERETNDPIAAAHQDGDLNIGVFVTAAGLSAIGIEPAGDEPSGDHTAGVIEPAPTPRISKRDAVVGLLSRDGGATLAELIAATDWLPHTTRAALTGLRKTGHAIERGKRGDVTCYSVTTVA